MPQERHAPPLTLEEALVVRSLGLRLPGGYEIEPHEHDWHQLVYAIEGVMTVDTPAGSWVVPAQRAVWIPAGLRHGIRTTGPVGMRTVYLRPGLLGLPEACGVIYVTDLLRALVLETLRLKMLREDVPEQARLAGVLTDQISRGPVAPLQIKLPLDPRAARVAARARADLSVSTPLVGLVAGSGASVRTIERLFRQETGMTFGRWLQQVKALYALELLASGEPVTSVGLAVGYDSTSAFISMFKRVLGKTPGTYFSASMGASAASPYRAN